MKTSSINTFFTSWLVLAGLTTATALAGQEERSDAGVTALERKPPSTEKRGGGERPGRGPHERGKPGDRLMAFKAADIDHDGILTFDEFSTLNRLRNMDEAKRRKLFDFLDRDKDGKLRLRELQSSQPRWLTPIRKDFNKLDVNHDGKLDMKEFSNLPQFNEKDKKLLIKFFEKIDRNKNGEIEKSELRLATGHHPRPQFDFPKYDNNSSGGLDFQEYSNIPWIKKFPEERRKKLFERLDADKNGEISPEEVKSAHRMHRPPPHRKASRPGRGGHTPERDREFRQKPNRKSSE